MIIDYIPQKLYQHKIRSNQNQIDCLIRNTSANFNTIDECLITSNSIALEYFDGNNNLLEKLWQYNNTSPKCGSYSLFTYAAFLSLTEKYNRYDLQDNVRWVGGMYVSDKGSGHHAWLEKKLNGEWKEFEAIPHMRNMSAYYSPWYTFQKINDRFNITSEKIFGMLAISVYGLFNS